MTAGAELAQLSVAVGAAPWKQDAGYLRDEPLYEPWREAMEETGVQALASVGAESVVPQVPPGEPIVFKTTYNPGPGRHVIRRAGPSAGQVHRRVSGLTVDL